MRSGLRSQGSLSQAKLLGGIGSILTLLGLAPFYSGTALVIIGWVLILIALKNVSDAVLDRSIFNNGIVASVLAIVGAVLGAFVFAGISSLSSSASYLTSSDIIGRIAGILLGLVVLWVLAIISSIFLWNSFKQVATKLNISLFRTSALIYLIGVVLTIVIVGFLIAFIAQILFAIAFFILPKTVLAASPQIQQTQRP